MKKWEYKLMKFSRNDHDMIEYKYNYTRELNEWGQEGWELVHIDIHNMIRYCTLKREIK